MLKTETARRDTLNLRIKPDARPMYWAGDGWWTLRKDQAKAFFN